MSGRRAPARGNRLHKALEDTGIKLDCVASDILGASGRPILAHLDSLDEQIEGLSDAIEAELGPTGQAGVALAATITGAPSAPPRSWSLKSAPT